MTLFLCIFLIPFVTIGVGMIVAAMMNLFGKVEVVVDELDSYVAIGIGIVKWKRRFDPHQVRSVSYGTRSWQSEGGPSKLIELAADRTIKFGSLLQPERMEWLRVVLKQLLLPGHGQRRTSTVPQLPWLYRKS
jgi:hypothetical protein